MSNPTEVLVAMNEQLGCVRNGARIVAAQLVCCEEPLDSAHPRAAASLWVMDVERPGYERQPQCVLRGELRAVNERARELDVALSKSIVPNVDGIAAISADPRVGGANAAVLQAAGAANKPVAGTGGTSLALAAAVYGCDLAGNAGGSVATTPRTRAIGIAASLAGAWREPYTPKSGISGAPWRSVVNECVPVLVCAACARALARGASIVGGDELLGSGTLIAPAVGALAATRRSELGSVATLAGAVLGACCRGSSCCALIACGTVLPSVAPHVLAACARRGVPATASNIAVGGAVPVLLGAAAYVIFAPLAADLSDIARRLLHAVLSWWPAAAAAAVAMNYGSRRGWYHAYFLPLIALEQERADMAALGALDCLCLCVCGAGACAAQLVARPSAPATSDVRREGSLASDPYAAYADQNIARENVASYPSSPSLSRASLLRGSTDAADAALARRGLLINLLCGDYVEACYPFLERDPTLDAATYVASAVAGALAAGSQSSAYLPLPIAIVLADESAAFALAALVAFFLPFLVGAASNLYRKRKAS